MNYKELNLESLRKLLKQRIQELYDCEIDDEVSCILEVIEVAANVMKEIHQVAMARK